jgi:glycosyltransferase involved in cell wall biosynthesis
MGGTETFLRAVIPRLAADHDVHVWTASAGELDGAGATVHPLRVALKECRATRALANTTPVLPAEVETATMLVSAAARQERSTMERMDVLSTHYYADALALSRWLETPTVFRFPGLNCRSPRWQALRHYGDVDAWIANSASTCERAFDWLRVRCAATIRAGVDLDAFQPNVSPQRTYDAPHAIYVGRLDDGKGLRRLIRAADTIDDLRLTLVGDGHLRDGLRALVDDRGLTDRVAFPGRVPHEDVPEWLVSADLFCLPSDHEGYPVSLMEALACGVPAVVSDLPAVREQTGTNGVVTVPPGDLSALVDAIRSLLEDGDRRQQLADAAREQSRQFGWDSQADELAAVYRKAIDQQPRSERSVVA